jgi:hypothetical protein
MSERAPESASHSNAIATLNEGPLHSALKAWYARAGDLLEVPVDGRQIDIVRGDLLIEIQTRNLAAIRRKLEVLLEIHHVHLVHPVAHERWILRVEGDDHQVTGRRRSPRRGRLEDAFKELVSVAKLLSHPRFSCEILLTREEEVRRHEPGRAWRRNGWVVVERRLLDVVESHILRDPRDLCRTLPLELPAPFTATDLAAGLRISPALAQKMAYCLREAGAITTEGKRGHARTYRVCD